MAFAFPTGAMLSMPVWSSWKKGRKVFVARLGSMYFTGIDVMM
jgi:hypothetical protein